MSKLLKTFKITFDRNGKRYTRRVFSKHVNGATRKFMQEYEYDNIYRIQEGE